MRKINGVSTKIHEDFYKKMEALRLQLKLKHNINIKSHTQLTGLLAKNKGLFQNNKQWIKEIKLMGY